MLDTNTQGCFLRKAAFFMVNDVTGSHRLIHYFCPMIMIYILLVINLFTFIIFGWDKRLSIKHKRRIPESTLLGVTFVGGTLGSVLGMLIFRHKISKKSFLLKFALVVLVQAGLIYWLWNTGQIQNPI